MTKQQLKQHFRYLKQNNQLPNNFLLLGSSMYLLNTAEHIIADLNCLHHNAIGCSCRTCTKLQKFRDEFVLYLQPVQASINSEQIRTLQEWSLYLNKFQSVKYFIVQNTDCLTKTAANQLLKFLESSPSKIIGIFLATSQKGILKTLLSRLQIFTFNEAKLVDKNLLNLSAPNQAIIKDVHSSMVLHSHFISQIFTPLLQHCDYLISRIRQQKVLSLLVQKDWNENFIIEHFWLFLKILSSKIQNIIFNTTPNSKILCRKQDWILAQVFYFIVKMSSENQFLFLKTKNYFRPKLAYLDFLCKLERWTQNI